LLLLKQQKLLKHNQQRRLLRQQRLLLLQQMRHPLWLLTQRWRPRLKLLNHMRLLQLARRYHHEKPQSWPRLRLLPTRLLQ
jgi:hypothetical protein